MWVMTRVQLGNEQKISKRFCYIGWNVCADFSLNSIIFLPTRFRIPFGNARSLEILFRSSHRSVRCIPAPDGGCEVELRGQVRSQVQLWERAETADGLPLLPFEVFAGTVTLRLLLADGSSGDRRGAGRGGSGRVRRWRWRAAWRRRCRGWCPWCGNGRRRLRLCVLLWGKCP
ncbi:MAG: hypothetical protein BWX80_03703 [Candidatus Hydrogenedentes bacterium ADurb.Bin101]|nr:MAG: hypothetical protein BWX80_03703 [Candidatus Hydrogenedentes bacterium ADurb.Bin101]